MHQHPGDAGEGTVGRFSDGICHVHLLEEDAQMIADRPGAVNATQ
jgi:hypothetical protein